MAGRIFISYSKEQPEPTRALSDLLTAEGYTVWWDTNLKSGEVFRTAIDRELESSNAVIVIWTEQSVASKWVVAEADHADRENKLITVRTKDLEPWRIPKPYNTYHADVVDDHAAILASVRRLAGEPERTKAAPQSAAAGFSLSERSIQEALALEYWQAIKDTADATGLRAYLAEFGASKCASLALSRLRAQASAAWKSVDRKSEPSLSAFLAQWPEAVEADDARKLVGALATMQALQQREPAPEVSQPAAAVSEPPKPPAKRAAAWPKIAAGVAALGALALILAWQPWKAAPHATLPPTQQTTTPQRDPGVSLTELSMRMANEALVKSAVIRATSVLAGAGKTMEFYEEGCDKDAKVRDIYRGMMLAHAGYFLVMADLRTGSYQNYGFLPEDHAYLEKASLYSFWTMDRVTALWRSSNALASLDGDDKKALAAFLTELKGYRAIYAAVKRVKPNLAQLNWLRGSPVEFAEINEILKRSGRPPISKCYLSDYGYRLTWNVTPTGGTAVNFMPVDYMFSFWYRRDSEGKEQLADTFITSMIGWLK